MRSFLVALASSLLLCSDSVLSHAVSNAKVYPIGDVDVSSSYGNKVARIIVHFRDTEWNSEDGSSCKQDDEDCHGPTNRYGFRCGDEFFNQAKVLAAANDACPRISENKQNDVFPAPYIASSFSKSGPYQEWPITRNGRLWNKWSRNQNRLVMTMDCTVVGAVIRNKKTKEYEDCEVEEH